MKIHNSNSLYNFGKHTEKQFLQFPMSRSDDAIDKAFEGDPMNTWNVD